MGEAPQFKMTKMTAEDDPEAYLQAFKEWQSWRYQWTTILAPYLTGPIPMAMNTLPVTEARDYKRVKGMILSTLNISEETYWMT